MSSLGSESLSLSGFRFQTNANCNPTLGPSLWIFSTRNCPECREIDEIQALWFDGTSIDT